MRPMIVDAEYEEEGQLKPCFVVVEVPVAAIDGTSSVGAVLEVRGKGDPFVVLKIGDKSVCVNGGQLRAALHSLEAIRFPRRMPMLPPGADFGG